MAPTSTSKSVNNSCESVAGVWTRLFEEDPLGDEANADRSTLVVWTQTSESGIYVDIRLPLGSPGRQDTACNRQRDPTALCATSGKSLMDYDIAMLAQQKSFAGVLNFNAGDTTETGEALAKDNILAEVSKKGTAALPLCTCFWRRDIDYQPPTGGLDIGVCASYSVQTDNGMVDMRETGDDGSYAEGWRRMANTNKGPFMALELLSENGSQRVGYWVRAGRRFAYAIGRPASLEVAAAIGCDNISVGVCKNVGRTLAEVMDSMSMSEDKKVAVLGTYVAVVGEIISTHEKKESWRIFDSTHPALVDCHLVGDAADLKKEDFICSFLETEQKHPKEAKTVDQIVGTSGECRRKWKIVELSGCSLPFF